MKHATTIKRAAAVLLAFVFLAALLLVCWAITPALAAIAALLAFLALIDRLWAFTVGTLSEWADEKARS